MSLPTVSFINAYTTEITSTLSAHIDVSTHHRAIVVATGADLVIALDDNDVTPTSPMIPAGGQISVSLSPLQSIRAKTISGTGYLTVYPY